VVTFAGVRRALADKRIAVPLQLLAVVVLLGALAWAARDVWPDAAPRLRSADPVDLGIALGVLAGYYLLFVLGWMWILRAFGVRLPYVPALQAEMLSMLAKYVPGGIWTPAARVYAARRFGVKDTPVVLASILLEAGLSALAGVAVFVVGLLLVTDVDAPLLPLLVFSAIVGTLVHPRVFQPLARRLLRPFGASDVPPLRARTVFGLLAFYAATWPLGGLALFFIIRSVGGDPSVASIPFLGGVTAVGAIVSVLVVFAPSGLGVREATVYGLILAVTSEGVALGAIVLNRLAITVVEAVLLLVGALLWRTGRRATVEERPAGEPSRPAPEAVLRSPP
jgi:glycosyltransferase 2 family protein